MWAPGRGAGQVTAVNPEGDFSEPQTAFERGHQAAGLSLRLLAPVSPPEETKSHAQGHGAAWPAGTPPGAQPGRWRGPHCPCWNVPVVSSSWVWGLDPVRLQLHRPPPGEPQPSVPVAPLRTPSTPAHSHRRGSGSLHPRSVRPVPPTVKEPPGSRGRLGPVSPFSSIRGRFSNTRELQDFEG